MDISAELFRSAPDGATHEEPCRWCLQRHQCCSLPHISPTRGPVAGRKWYLNRQGLTMIAVAPGFFQPYDYDFEKRRATLHGGRFPTVLHAGHRSDLARLPPVPRVARPPGWRGIAIGETLTCPPRTVLNSHVDLKSMMLYCNWLSRSEGRTPCYRLGKSDDQVGSCDFRANGYRLATEAEWEHSFRDGTTTEFVTGDDVERLLDYGALSGAMRAAPRELVCPTPGGCSTSWGTSGKSWEYPLLPGEVVLDPSAPSPRQFREGGSGIGRPLLCACFRQTADRPRRPGWLPRGPGWLPRGPWSG